MSFCAITCNVGGYGRDGNKKTNITRCNRRRQTRELKIDTKYHTLALRSVLFKHQAVVIDMEEGVVNEILKGPLRDVFDCQQLITDVSGSGNNW